MGEETQEKEKKGSGSGCPECSAPIDDLRASCPECGYEYDEKDYNDTEAGKEFVSGANIDDEGNEITDKGPGAEEGAE